MRLTTKNYARVIARKRLNALDPIWTLHPFYYYVYEFRESKKLARKLNISVGIVYTIFFCLYVVTSPFFLVFLFINGFAIEGPYGELKTVLCYAGIIFTAIVLAYMAIINISGIRWALRNIHK